MTEETLHCLICDDIVPDDSRYPVFQSFTPHTGILLKDLLQRITRIMLKETDEKEKTVLCKNCFKLLEQLDFSEYCLAEIKKQIYQHLEKKHGKSYTYDSQFIEVACQTEEYLFSLKDTVIVDDIKVETLDESDNFENKRVYSCKICTEKFKKLSEYKKHLKDHESPKFFECKFCENTYATKTGLFNHMMRKHRLEKAIGNENTTFFEPSVVLECDIKVENTEVDAENQIVDDTQADFNDNISSDADSEYKPSKKSDTPRLRKRKRGRPSKQNVQTEEKSINSNDDAVEKPQPSEPKDTTVKTEKEDIENNSDSENFFLDSFQDSNDNELNQMSGNGKRRRGRPKKNSEGDNIVIKPYIFQCPQCPKKWRTKSELRIHLHSHSDVRAHVCDICGQAYKKRVALDIHLGMHNGINPFTCEICGKVFTQKGALNRHLPIHTGEANYQCDLCGKRFIHHTSFSMHALTHSGLKAYKCEICGLGLMSTSHLKRHMRAHSGEKKYGCSQCGKRFAERYNLAAHERLHFSPGEKRKRNHPCPLCGDTFQRRQKLEEHLASTHNKILDSDESRKWAGSMLTNSPSVSGVNGQSSINNLPSTWTTFAASSIAFPQNIKPEIVQDYKSELVTGDSNEISSS